MYEYGIYSVPWKTPTIFLLSFRFFLTLFIYLLYRCLVCVDLVGLLFMHIVIVE